MNRRLVSIVAGLVILVGVAGVVAVSRDPDASALLVSTRIERVTVAGDVGGEKMEFLANPEVQRILRDRHGVTVQAKRVGSVDMARHPSQGADFIWPAHDVAADIFRSAGRTARGGETQVFSSPLVVLTWEPVAKALEAKGLVERRDGVWYLLRLDGLLELVAAGTQWRDIGLPELWGPVNVVTTHGGTSASGLMFSTLMATVLNGGRTPTAEDMETLGPRVRGIYQRLGRMEDSSGKLFEQFLRNGMGQFPLMAGYENQLVEFYEGADEGVRRMVAKDVRVLYPVPTAFASHPILGLTQNGRRLVEALKDPDIQRIAWTRHGFRVTGGDPDARPGAAAVIGMPRTITGVVAVPATSAVERLIDHIPAN
jgi:hypothetical protein